MKFIFGILISFLLISVCTAQMSFWGEPMAQPCAPSGQNLPPPTNVRHLHPSQVNVIGALGDSITAAFALNNEPWEYRLWSWSIGAESMNVTHTLFNLIEAQNPKVQGGAVKTVLPGDVIPKNKTEYLMAINQETVCNAAVSGAKAQDVFQQIDYLVWKLQKMDTVDFQNDWKVITLLIGANDLCVSCYGHQSAQPPEWANTMDQLLSTIQQRIPRVFVNLVSILNISQVWTTDRTKAYCRAVEAFVDECPCLTKHGEDGRKAMDNNTVLYNREMRRLAAQYQALNDPYFTVVYQPTLQEAILPCNTNFVSDLDCFHPNRAAHNLLAITLWNNMLTPPGQKIPLPLPFIQPICPTDSSFFQ